MEGFEGFLRVLEGFCLGFPEFFNLMRSSFVKQIRLLVFFVFCLIKFLFFSKGYKFVLLKAFVVEKWLERWEEQFFLDNQCCV